MFMCFVRMGGFTGMGMIGLLQMRPIPSHQTKRLRCREVKVWISSLFIRALLVRSDECGEVTRSIRVKQKNNRCR